jgi:hypothetical protein
MQSGNGTEGNAINVRGNVLKVVEMGLQNKVYDAMKKPGFSVEGLARQLQNEGVDITPQSIRKFIKKSKDAQKEIIQQDMKMSSELSQLAMDYNKELKDILKEIQVVKNDAKDTKDYVTYNQMISRILQGIELLAKITGDMKPKANINYDIKVIYNEINNDIEKQMSELKNEKIIDVEYEIKEEDKIETEKTRQGK